jgi:3-dehydroquinate synthase
VYIDVDHLKTLPPRHFISGMAEVVKCGVIADARLFAFLEAHVEHAARREPQMMSHLIERCCRLKARVVADDPFEANRRKILNFGHTIGHALETLSDLRLTHGEAVAIGMAAEARIAWRLGLLPREAAERIAALPGRLGLPTSVPAGIGPADVLRIARRDKKNRAGKITCALPVRIGAMASRAGDYGIPVEDALIFEVLHDLGSPRAGTRH